nr:hypothetical protein [Maliibacterium massiliense]
MWQNFTPYIGHLLLLLIVGMGFSCIRPTLWRIKMNDVAFACVYPIRALLGKFSFSYHHKAAFCIHIRVHGAVNAVGVLWQAFFNLALLTMLIGTATGALSAPVLASIVLVVDYVFLAATVLVAVLGLVADNRTRSKYKMENVIIEDVRAHEQAVAEAVAEAAKEFQSALAPLGYSWRVEVRVTDLMHPDPGKNPESKFKAMLSGEGMNNPHYISRMVLNLLKDGEEVGMPSRARSDYEICYTANKTLVVHSVSRISEVAHGIMEENAMLLRRCAK